MTRQRKKPAASAKPTALNKDISAEKEARERALDETIAETFPASDPLSTDPNPSPSTDDEDKIAS